MTGQPARAPLYARALRLRHLRPGGLSCFLLFEGMLALGVLLALAELVSWWAVPALPAAVAAMVKVNDVLAGALHTAPAAAAVAPDGRPPVETAAATGQPWPPLPEVRQVSRDLADTLDPVESPRQQFRQSARRRYR